MELALKVKESIKAWQRHVGEARTLGLSSRSKAVLPIHCLEPSAASEQKCVICQEICGITSGQQQGSDTQIPEEKFSLVVFFFILIIFDFLKIVINLIFFLSGKTPKMQKCSGQLPHRIIESCMHFL